MEKNELTFSVLKNCVFTDFMRIGKFEWRKEEVVHAKKIGRSAFVGATMMVVRVEGYIAGLVRK